MKYAGLMTLGIYLNLLVVSVLLLRSYRVADVNVKGGYVSVYGSVSADIRNPIHSVSIRGPVKIDSPVEVVQATDQKFIVEVSNRTPLPVTSRPDSTSPALPTSAENQKRADARLPWGRPVRQKGGFVWSPYLEKDDDDLMLDFTGVPPGTKVECPFTHGFFILPPPM